MSDIELIKKIREKTGLPFADIKKAISEAGDSSEEKIIEILRKRGILKQASRSDRVTSNGYIFSYVHEGRVGVLLEVKCETDFVSRSQTFQALGSDIALHIAAYQPIAVKPEDVDPDFVQKEMEIAKEQMSKENKPPEIMEKILEGKRKKLTEEGSLLTQPFLKNPDITVSEYISEISLSTGEKIEITRFTIFNLS